MTHINGGQRHKRRRHNLFLKDPHCHWCGCEVVLSEPPHSPYPDNQATLDHLQTKFAGRRYVRNREMTVLACLKCNGRRGREEMMSIPTLDRRFYERGMRAWIFSVAILHLISQDDLDKPPLN